MRRRKSTSSLVVLRQLLQAKVANEVEPAPRRRGPRRRAGVVIPLFSIRSSSGWGLGEVPDLGRFAAWAGRAGFSVVQVLPVNETSGADTSPYGAASAFAIDPVYLSLDACEDFVEAGGRAALAPELQRLVTGVAAAPRVDWPIVRRLKQAGIALAFSRFLRDEWANDTRRARELAQFSRVHAGWLEDHALFRAWHDRLGTPWWQWPQPARDRAPEAIDDLRRNSGAAILRVKWTAWQLDRQWRAARRAATAAGVELMGDLPFVVGLDASDVWAHRELFRTDLHVGTPPEPGAPDGQDWGLPVYDWAAQARDRFAWIRERAKRAGTLFGLYRIDHVMGFYRTYFRSADGRERGFTPADEHEQLALGETLMQVMGRWAKVIAEDLGAVPPYLRPSLERLGIPGYRVLRWETEGDQYRDPATWPEASVATNATHDTDMTAAWFDGLSCEQRERLRGVPGLGQLSATGAFDERARTLLLRVVYAAPSTLALVMFQDALGTRDRINVPGTCDDTNWTYRAAQTVEELLADTVTTERLADLAAETGRTKRLAGPVARRGERGERRFVRARSAG